MAKNQCDGCARGLPVENNTHYLDGHPVQGCDAGRYMPEALALLNEALAKVESKSIREWASSGHNRPLWLEIAQLYVNKGKPDAADWLTIDIVTNAMGM